MDPNTKAWIDGATYEELLTRWRLAPVGHLMFQGETGEYYKAVMLRKREEEPDGGVGASKRIGW